MPSSAGDQYTIRIGGDASGPVVAGRGNQVKVHRTGEAEPDSTVDADAAQRTNVEGHGIAYTVMRGELNIHHDAPGRSPEPQEG
ncbi:MULTISPECIES: hypothetical protein [unclassified Streptomyces]|uniref:hypothetical protein n=1 Tax=unclassified Streptomyces TaxID=2593676 RepID=UPI0036B21E0D